ncbi:MAG: porin [Alphaproteobacteria bacterium]|nr:porin [Alphaproteobacteria bacterium]
MKKELLIAASAVAVAGVASNANAIDVELYGQVNKGVMIVDDGTDTEFNVVDNDFSSTRFGLKGEQALDNGLTASALLEMEYQTNASDVLQQTNTAGVQNTPANVTGSLAARHSRVGLGGDFGAIFVGHTSTATDGITEQDMAGAGDVLGSDIEDLGGNMLFRTSGGGYSTDTIASATNNMDGNGRKDLVRYDSPIFNGFQVRVSAAQGGDTDTGVFYHGRVDEFAIKGGIGYVAFNDNTAGLPGATFESQVSGSVSAKHDSGFGATVAYGQQEIDTPTATQDDPTFYYVKLGYTWDAFEVAADYSKHENGAGVKDDETTYFGLAGQYNLGHGVSAAAYYKNFEFDDSTSTNFEDIGVYGVNMRVKF